MTAGRPPAPHQISDRGRTGFAELCCPGLPGNRTGSALDKPLLGGATPQLRLPGTQQGRVGVGADVLCRRRPHSWPHREGDSRQGRVQAPRPASGGASPAKLCGLRTQFHCRVCKAAADGCLTGRGIEKTFRKCV